MERGTSQWPTRALPGDGAFRVAPDPLDLPAGPFPPGTGPNRYDDPEGRFRVRYVARTLEGCLKELLDRTARPSPAFENRAAGYDTGAPPAGWSEEEDDDLEGLDLPPGPDPGLDDMGGMLARLHVARIAAERDAPCPVVDDENLIDELDRHHHIRAVFAAFDIRSVLGTRLTREVVRSRSRLVYRVTQAVSYVVHHATDAFGGVAYHSCVDTSEECWGVYDRTPVVAVHPPVSLLGDGDPDGVALRAAAAYLQIDLGL